MAKKLSQQAQFNLLMPSLALSALVFLLAIFIANGSVNQKGTRVVVQADQKEYLSEDDTIEDLESDLLLLQADDLESEASVLRKIN